ncbi:MAG: glycosyltransferase family 4 protein [Syntrophorhabdaceae bacterium]|nr:glycosyltransferase family 4 protein [Syntrophorhabdaceae bacterium]
MKVLLVNREKGWGGGQEYLKDMAVELRRRGIEFWFVVRKGSPSETRFREHGFPVHTMPYRHGLSDFKALLGLISLFKAERFDIISVNREHDLFMIALAFRLAFPFRRRGRLMMTYHIPVERKQIALGTVDAIVCVSEHVRDTLLRYNPKTAAKTNVLYCGIVMREAPPPSRFARDRRRRFFTDHGFPIIGMVGALWKNQVELVEMTPRLMEEFPGITVALVGNTDDISLLAPVQERVRRLGLEKNVIFTGFVPRERIDDIFHDMDLSVTTHRNEGFGIVHLESLAAGTPVVAYNEGGFVDIFRGEDAGVLVDGGPDEFAAVVLDLLKDDERRFAMGDSGYSLVKRRYSIEAMGDSYLKLYRGLIDAQSP